MPTTPQPFKIALAQIDVKAGNPLDNVQKMLGEIERSKKAGDDILIFSEMAIPGYLLGDEWENSAFVKDCFAYNESIKDASGELVVIWGNVDIDFNSRGEDGRPRKFNAAFIAQHNQYIGSGKTHKMLLPKYRLFDDERHFYSLRKEAQDQETNPNELLQPFVLDLRSGSVNLGLILCEDMWSDDYTINPIQTLLGHGADLIVNISCSPWTWRKNSKRHSVVRDRIAKHPAYFVYVNNVGIQNNGKNIFLFDGNSTIYNPDGSLNAVAKDYKEETIRSTLFDTKTTSVPNPVSGVERDTEELYTGLIYAIRKFFGNFSNKKVVLGLSGGIDSALSAALLAEALGPEQIFAVNMPSEFNSETTKRAAFELAKNLQIHHTSISIQTSVDHTIEQLESAVFKKLDGSEKEVKIQLTGLNKENIQARDRGSRLLAGVASALGAVFINNGNKTETAFGYATLYGDVNGALAPLADLYKLEVYALARYINEKKKVIPEAVFTIPPSAELSADQNVDEGKGDPIYYPYHDKLVKAFVEFRLDPEDILNLYKTGGLGTTLHFDDDLIQDYFKTVDNFILDLEHKWRLYKLSVFKRIQSPPIIAVSKRAFGFDLRESQNGFYYTQKYLQLKKELLQK